MGYGGTGNTTMDGWLPGLGFVRGNGRWSDSGVERVQEMERFTSESHLCLGLLHLRK